MVNPKHEKKRLFHWTFRGRDAGKQRAARDPAPPVSQTRFPAGCPGPGVTE
jgi:hypothetical protein